MNQRGKAARRSNTSGVTVAVMALLWLGLMPPGLAAGDLPIEPFEAGFMVYRYGFAIGEALMTLEAEGGGRYNMRSQLRPTGLFSMVFSEQIDEVVSGEFKDGTPRPLSYRQQRTGDKPRRVTLSFDWEQGQVLADKNGQETALALQSRVVDPLSWYLLAMSDLSHGRPPGEYTLVRSDSLKTYRVRRHADEVVKTPFGELNTLVISRQRPDRDKAIKVWHAPQLGFLPVQVSKIERGQEVFRMTIRDLKGSLLPTEGATTP